MIHSISLHQSRPKRLQLPQTGESIFQFHLRQELGHGAFARVFLAQQADLASRPVVLKVSAIDGDEPQTLAQLQHTHIVPIYSVHEDTANGLRAVCMPYFGGASLARILEGVWKHTPCPTKGDALVGSLNANQEEIHPRAALPPGMDGLEQLGKRSFIQATAWVVACLADALQHAHERGILHQDIKPSNILLSSDGQPLLLDFNLSRKISPENAQTSAMLGGTVAYMSPEHLRALLHKNDQPGGDIDARADIYSLGMVLYYMLVGELPFEHKGSYAVLHLTLELMAMERSRVIPSARKKRPDVPWSLESIVRKCLHPDRTHRYQKASDLAEDLRCFLEDLPLQHASELSYVERAKKWLRRHPRLTSSGSVATIAMMLLCAAGAGLFAVQEHLSTARAELAVSQAQERKRQFDAGAQRARCLINTTIDLQDNLRAGLPICEQTLALYDLLAGMPGQDHPDWQHLDKEVRLELANDARELLMLLAWGRVRLNAADPGTLRQALSLLDRAEAIKDLPESRALWEDRAQYLSQLGDAEAARLARAKAQRIHPSNHYLLASSYAHQGNHAAAIAHLDKALAQQPNRFWASFLRGLCHQEQGNYTLAAGDFGVCIGLWPDYPLGYFNRGYVLDLGGNKTGAVRDYTTALQHDAKFLPAYINRGMARLELKEYAGALEDFHKAREMGRDDASLHAGRGVALEGLKRHREADEAFAQVFAMLPAAPADVQTRIRWVYGFAICGRRPQKALASFDEVLHRNPFHPQALYGRAMILIEQGQQEKVLPLLNQAIEVSPNFMEARRCRAILLARCRQFEAASLEVNTCLEREPNSGSMLYAAACVASLAAEKATDPLSGNVAAKQACTFLEKALAHGYGHDRVMTDPDLNGVRSLPEFARLVKQDTKRQ